MRTENNIYNMSFTAGAAMMNETLAVAITLLECNGRWERAKEITFKKNLMNKCKVSSNQRYFVLVKQRLETLNDVELHMFVNSTMAIRKLLILLSICKTHAFIYDFITENVRECFYNMQEKVTYASFNEFYNEKKYEHPELEKVTEKTVAKMRQVIFKILEQTGIIESAESGELRRPYLTEELERLIVLDDAKWLAIYLYSNNEISNLHDLYA